MSGYISNGNTPPTGPAGGDLDGVYPSPKVSSLQGRSVPNIIPAGGQSLVWNGSNWIPGIPASGGGGGGGLVYFLNEFTNPQSPTTGLTAPVIKQLGRNADVPLTTVTKSNLSTGGVYDLVAGFVTDVGDPGGDYIPAGIWDFNVWVSSNATKANDILFRVKTYIYNGSSVAEIGRTPVVSLYDPAASTQYSCAMVMSPTTILLTDRIYITLEATAIIPGLNITFNFGDGFPSHVHTTLPSVEGTGIVHVINGILQTPASPVNLASVDVSGTLPVSNGGIGITSGNSGGIPYFDSTSTIQSSATLTDHALTLGAGAGAAPYSLSSLGTSSTVLHGNASGDPTFGPVSLTSDVSNILPIANGGTNLSSSGASGNILVSNGSAWSSVPMTGNVTITSTGVTTVNAVQNVPVSSTTPSTNDVLQYNGTNWVPSSIISTLQTSYQTVRAQGNISAGDVCYIVNAGGSNPYPTVAKAQSNSLSTIKGVIGLAIANIANNTIGTVQTYGQLIGPVNTQSFSQGAPLYVSATTAGGVTDVKPAGPNYTFQIGFVTRQGQPQNVTTGIVFVSPMMQTDTQNISDLALTSQAEHDVLTYEASTAQWKNKQRLWVPNTQNSLQVDNGTIITAANFLNIVYLPIVTQGGANKTLNATTPIARLSKTNVDYGRELWLHNVDNSKSVTIPAGGSVLLDGGVNLVLVAGAIAKFMWTGIGGNGSWIQTGKALTVA